MNKLELNIDANGRGTVKLNGQVVQATAISVVSKAHEPTLVTLKLLASVEGQLEVEELTSHRTGLLDKPEGGIVVKRLDTET